MWAFRGLRARLTMLFLAVAAGIALVTSLIVLVETHYHFALYQRQTAVTRHQEHVLDAHLEQALQQSVVWTALGVIILAAAVSFFVARRIAGPLIEMKRVAEQMIGGRLDVRTAVRGRDEVADLGRALNHLATALREQEELRKTMTADIAHELRTPLATVKSHLEAFLDGVWEPTPDRLRSCYEEIERLIGLVKDLEVLTRLEAPDFRLHPEESDLQRLAARAVETHCAAFLQKGVKLTLEGGRPVWAMADRERMMQVMSNLLSNALKFTPHGGQVIVKVEQDGGWAVISVRDNGCGIPEEEVSKVFERFYRVDKSRSRRSGGAGIGLTIVKRLVESHGGT
ncbi:MAG: HAMP domain-containing histidine kinase, partial [Alicyclobacillaceae bacterium]|nr:HAMP domain-containing histidine kinase [Alicyclobacillaceae bacterium]